MNHFDHVRFQGDVIQALAWIPCGLVAETLPYASLHRFKERPGKVQKLEFLIKAADLCGLDLKDYLS